MVFVTIRDVAREAGVSITAVSQILNGKGRFSDKTRSLVQKTAESMGYVPDQRAQSMRLTDTKTVGLLVPDLRNQYFADLVASMNDDFYEKGYSTFIGTASEDVSRQDAFIVNLLGQHIDGAVIVPQGVGSPGMELLIQKNIPIVFVDRLIPGTYDVPSVVSDPRPGLTQAIQRLRQLGHRKIGFVSHPLLHSFSVNEREVAFRSIVTQFDDMSIDVEECDATYESRDAALTRMIGANATAVIFSYSPDAIAMAGLLHNRGIAIGDDVSVVSFDDIETFRLMTPQISIISQQAKDMGHRGVEMLLRCLSTQKPLHKQTYYVPTVFIERESVGARHEAGRRGQLKESL